jgi:hypothetical protein
MRVAVYIRRAVTTWMLWRARRSLRTAVPALVGLDTKKAVLARQHRSGGREIALERKRLVTERLRMEITRG